MNGMRREALRKIDVPKAMEAIECLKRSFELTHAGRLQEAAQELQSQIDQHPGYPFLHFRLGIVLFDLDEHEAATEVFEKELEINPGFREAAWELGSAYSRLGLVDQSVEAYERALDIDPCCVEALFGLGNACLRKQEYQEAIRYYRDALFLRPELDLSNPASSDQLAQALAARIHYNLAMAQVLSGAFEAAQEALENARELDREGPIAERSAHYLRLLSSQPDKQPELAFTEFVDLPIEKPS